jgi:hypothetical protein
MNGLNNPYQSVDGVLAFYNSSRQVFFSSPESQSITGISTDIRTN